MISHSKNRSVYCLHQRGGATLIVSLFILLLVLIVSASLFRGNNLSEKIAGNTREKLRAMQTAQDALAFGENWLDTAPSTSLTPVAASACNGTATLAALQVCPSTNLATASNTSSLNFFRYSPPGMSFAASSTAGGLANTTPLSDINYSQQPAIYIAYLGLLSGTTSPLYQVTAIGYGGNSRTVAVLQSTYKPGTTVTNNYPPILSAP